MKTVNNKKPICLVINDAPTIKRDGVYYTTRDTYFNWILELSKYLDIYYCVPAKEDPSKEIAGFFAFSSTDSVKIFDTYYFEDFKGYYLHLPFIMIKNIRMFYSLVKKSDIVYFRLPSMNPFLVYWFAKYFKKRILTYVVGDQRELIARGGKYSGIIKGIAMVLSEFNTAGWKKLVNGSALTIFLGKRLYEQFGKYCERHDVSFVSMISVSNIALRTDTCCGNVINILYVGRLSCEKGVNVLLDCFEQIQSKLSDARLIVVGTGPEMNVLQKKCAAFKWGERVVFEGYVLHGNRFDEIMMGSDLFVLPSLSEGIPKVILEAMAKGLPVVATNVGGVPEIIKDGRNGLIVAPGSPEDLANAISIVVHNQEFRRRIIKGGYEFVRANTMERKARELAVTLHSLLRCAQEDKA